MISLIVLKDKVLIKENILVPFIFLLIFSAFLRLSVLLFKFNWHESNILKASNPFLGKIFKPLTNSQLIYLIKRVAHFAPWRVMCLEQALLGAIYYNTHQIPYSFHLGVSNTQTSHQFAAHAWLFNNGQIITGGAYPGEFQEIYNYSS